MVSADTIGSGGTGDCTNAQLSGAKPGYCLLAPLPQFGNAFNPANTKSFGDFMKTTINLAIVLSAVLAVVQIVIGGFKYMTSESFGMKGEGRSQMLGAVLGLVLLSASYLILYTINPNILHFTLSLQDQRAPNSPPPTGQVSSETISGNGGILTGSSGANGYTVSTIDATASSFDEAKTLINEKIKSVSCSGRLEVSQDPISLSNGTYTKKVNCFPVVAK